MTTQLEWASERYADSGSVVADNIQVATEEICKRLDQQNRLLGHLIMALLVEYSSGTQAPFVSALKDIFKQGDL